MRIHRTFALSTLQKLRRSSARRPILAALVGIHNTSYHLISFFASHKGTHPKHKIINYHRFFLDHITSTDKVIDIGSSTGEVTYDIAQKARYVVGIELIPERVAEAQRRYAHQKNMSWIIGDATTYKFDELFDTIILSNTLEHIKDRVEFLSKLRTLAPRILIRVPMITRDWISVYKKQQGFEYRLDHTHYIEYDEQTFAEEMHKAGYRIISSYINFGELYAIVDRI